MKRNPVAILWDHASCPPPVDSTNEYTFAIRLRELCRTYGNINMFKIYYGLANNDSCTPPRTDISLALESAGIIPVYQPKLGFGALATDALCFSADNIGDSPMVVFVTGNPALSYTASALKARNVNVGFIVPGQLATDVSIYGSWVLECDQVMEGNAAALVSSMKASSIAQNIPKNVEAILDTFTEATELVTDRKSINDPSLVESKMLDSGAENAFTGSIVRTPTKAKAKPKRQRDQSHTTAAVTHQPRTVILYEAALDDIPQPLSPVVETGMFGVKRLSTTLHRLHMLETEPPYAGLIRDQEAIKVKTWRRQLKQIFYYETVEENPQVPVKLESLFSEIEQYDKMTRSYLAFSKIGKLMTQVSQKFLSQFDYRKSYTNRAKALLIKWQKIVDSPGV